MALAQGVGRLRILVTGATGFVGSAVVRQSLPAGYVVRALVRRGSDQANLAGLSVELVEGDLGDAGSVRRALDGCQGLIHAAADYRLWVRDPQAMFKINVDATQSLMIAAMDAGVERIVYTSSVATLGIVKGGVADEETPSSIDTMVGVYKRSKFLAEQAVSGLIRERRLPAVIVNPSAPIGPGDIKPTPTGRMVVDAINRRMPAYVDTGLNVVHVDDCAAGHLLAFEKGRVGARYILGGDNLHLSEILQSLARIAGHRPPLARLSHTALMPVALFGEGWGRLSGREPRLTLNSLRMARKRMFFSSEKAKAELGYTARPADEALRDAVTYFRARETAEARLRS